MTVPQQKVQKALSHSPQAAEKVRMRREFLKKRDSLAPQSIEPLSKTILRRFWRLQAVRELDARRRKGEPVWLSCYLDFGKEVQTRTLMRKALARGYRVAVPVVRKGKDSKLILSEIKEIPGYEDPGPTWVRSGFGILEPRSPDPVDPKRMDFFVLPGLAFEPHGFRLGFGRGYYDQLLASARTDAWRIAVAFSFQMTSRLPREAWDVPMHRVVTESGVIRCNRLALNEARVRRNH